MRVRRALVMTGVLGGALVLTAPRPAGATATATSSGTVVTVTVTGNDTIGFRCVSGKIAVIADAGTVNPSPAVNCTALTRVIVNGDDGSQTVNGTGLDNSAFTAKPKLTVALTGGVDSATETLQADSLDLGSSSDDLILRPGGVVNTLLDLGTGNVNIAILSGRTGNDAITVASSNANLTLALSTGGGPASTWVVAGATYVEVDGAKGDDTISAVNVGAGSALERTSLFGGDGDDTITAGAKPLDADGGTGTNTFNLGPAADRVSSSSETDTVNGTSDGADDTVEDEDSLRFGGRTLNGFAGAGDDIHRAGSDAFDLTVRIRPGAGGTALETFSLQRFGQQQIPAGIDTIGTYLGTMTSLEPRLLADVVVPGQDVEIGGMSNDHVLIDITVPTGSWTDTVAAGTRTIATSSSSLGSVELGDDTPYRVHGPWTNQNQGFGYRVYRDLLLRFATDAERDQVRDQLTNGTKTRAQVISGIVATDTYRGLDVDRVFLRYLRRAADPGGRTYWVNAIGNGRSLRQFRAQLFGSNEYFNKAGATNAGFVARAYEDVLGRAPDPSGLTYWTNKANSGVDRGQIARQFLSSSEAKRSLVRDQFLRFIDRQPTSTEIDTWTATLDSSANGEQALVSFLAGSSAYFNRT